MEKDIKLFNDIYLDLDTDPKVSKGFSYIINTITTTDGRYKISVNVKGNELIADITPFHDSPHAIFTLKGSCVDNARSRIIFFITSSTARSHIIYFDVNTLQAGRIMGQNPQIELNFGDISANIEGDLLYWTDKVNPPRKINYIKAYNLTNSVNTDYKYQVINADIIEAYKKPPSTPISGGAGTSIYATKNIPNKLYQFAYRYTYDDFEKSVLSPFSDTYFSDIQQFADGTGTLYSSAYAIFLYFKLFLKVNNTFTDINSVELYVRNSDSGNWYLYDTIKTPKIDSFIVSFFGSGSYDNGSGIVTTNTRVGVTLDIYNRLSLGQFVTYNGQGSYIREKFTSGSLYLIGLDNVQTFVSWETPFIVGEDFNYIFKDDKVKQAVDQSDLSRPFDFMPKFAGTQEMIEKDKIIYADITEGFDSTKVDVETIVNTQNNSLDSSAISGILGVLSGSGFQYVTIRWASYSEHVLYYLNIFYHFTANIYNNITASYVSVPGDTETDILTYLKNALLNTGISNVTLQTNVTPAYKYLRIPTTAFAPFYPGIDLSFNFATSYSLKSTFKSLKNRDSYLVAIRYFDKNLRFSSENKSDKEVKTPEKYLNFNEFYNLTCKIHNKPPVDAYYYSIDFTKRTKVGYFLRLVCSGFNIFFGATDGDLRIQVNRIINDSINTNKNLKITSYEYEPGDRITIYGQYFDSTTSFIYSQPLDKEIKGIEWPKTDARYQKDYATTPQYIVDSTGNKVNNPESQVIIVPLKLKDFPVGIGLIALYIEIYRPKKESSNPFYFPTYFGVIGNPGLANNYHIGISQNQDPNNPQTTPAIIDCNPGDVYLKLRFANSIFPAIDDNYSDYYESNSYGYGMPGVYDPDAKEEHLVAGMRYSGSLLHDTKINMLNRFDSENREILKSKFGTINVLKEVGDVLKVLQDKKETSIYIGKEQIKSPSPDGSDILRTSTKVLGSQNTYDEIRGTRFRKSAVSHNRHLYYWDDIRREVIRSSPNGQLSISGKYNMNTYFKNKDGYTDVIAGFDEENSMYLITFIGGQSITLGFYDPEIESENDRPKWVSFYSYVPEMYQNIGKYLLAFKEGSGWKMNSDNVNRCTFFGVKYKQQIDVTFNSLVKRVYRSLKLKSNKAWSIPVIVMEPDASYPRGFLSLLNTNHFQLIEGQFFASYLNNMLTTSNVPSSLDLINGDFLRGFYIKHQMENNEDVEVWLMSFEVGFEVSNKY